MTAETPIPESKKLDVSKIETRALSACSNAQTLRITSPDEARLAADFLNNVINPLIREGDELFDPLIAAAYRTHQLAIATKKKAVGGLPAAKEIVRGELARWQQKQEELARAEQLRIEQEARDAEAARVEREIEAIEASGDEDAAEQVTAVLEAPRVLELPAVAPPPKIEGVSYRDVYTAEVVSAKEFYGAIASGRISHALATPNQSALNRMATAMKEGFNLPGCRVIKTKTANSAARRF